MKKKKDEFQFNRLVLVGNGFDLALGLKTRYSDFILWLLKKYFSQTIKNEPAFTRDGRSYRAGYLNNNTFEIGIRTDYSNVSYEKEIIEIDTIKDLKKFWEHYNIDYKIKSKLLNQIVRHDDELGWVDIESLFYQELKKCIDKESKYIVQLNNELDFLSKELKLYLYEIDTLPDGAGNFESAVCNQLTQEIKKNELIDEDLVEDNKTPDIIYFLNFNYTKALYNITKNLKSGMYTANNIETEWNPIHGQAYNSDAPMVFGFGDETDKNYEKIEDLNNNTFFEHIKSFKYSQTTNYQHLIRFLDSANYQVFIYGHSCGLSDRTMLKEIFEHENCKSIKVFFHKTSDESDDFLEKTMEISRHFSNKAIMRRKVVNKELSSQIPQNI